MHFKYTSDSPAAFKQAAGESSADYYTRLMDLADEVDFCIGNPKTCAEAQIKMILLMGVRH